MSTGVISMGIKCPIIREGDNLANIVVKAVLDATAVYNNGYDFSNNEPFYYDINDKDIIGITESVVARAQGNYATIDEIADEIRAKLKNPRMIAVVCPIYSRNRFSMILKAIARAAQDSVTLYMPPEDEVGNPSGVNRFTGVNMIEYYREIVESENKYVYIHNFYDDEYVETAVLYCGLHDYKEWKAKRQHINNPLHLTLADILSDKCEYGLLGSNKANENTLKLFPSYNKGLDFCNEVKQLIKDKCSKDVIVCIYGDGCFKDPVGGIWEFADPVSMPAYTDADIIESTPNEIKIKAFADDQFKDLSGDELTEAVKTTIKKKDSNLVGKMASQGTTPRLYRDLLASLMDLTSGSGDKGTPIVLVQNYFNNFTSN